MSVSFEHVQIIRTDLIMGHGKERFPHLWEEVYNHDKVNTSNWYDLTPAAWKEFVEFSRMIFFATTIIRLEHRRMKVLRFEIIWRLDYGFI
jgi:hypothetical protein